MPAENRQPDSQFRAAAIGYATAVEVISAWAILIGLPFLGAWLDGRWGSWPWLLVSGFVLGFVCSGVSFWRLLCRLGSRQF